MATLGIDSKIMLNTGYEIPILGYGVYQTPAGECEEVVSHALKVGYRHVDSAAAYRNESPCGLAIHKSSIPRSEIFFTSKISPRQLSYGTTKATVDATLKETGFGYIDLMLIHAPYGGSANRKGAWKALVEAQEAGKIRSIGVSNYGVHHLDELETHIRELERERGGPGRGGKISVGQWELHPWLQRKDIVSWCRERGVVLQAYSPLVRGQRSDDEKLGELAMKYGKTPAQVLLRWSLQKGFVPLPKSVTKSRIEENTDLFDFELSKEDVERISSDGYEPCAWDPTTSSLQQ
ncbi:unnamed protein product [Calypogeia fissa]